MANEGSSCAPRGLRASVTRGLLGHSQENVPSPKSVSTRKDSNASPEESSGKADGKNVHCALRQFLGRLWLHKGILLVLLSCLLNALSAVCVKMIGEHIRPSQVVALRLATYAMCSSVCLLFWKVPLRVNRKQSFWLLMMILCGFTELMLAYYAYQTIPVGDTSAILYSSPIITGFFAWLLLREKFALLDAFFAVVTVVGIVLIARPSFLFRQLLHEEQREATTLLGVCAAVVSATFASLVYVVLRKLGGIRVHPLIQVWLYGLVGSALASIIATAMGVWEVPYCGRERMLLMLATFPGFFGQVFVTYALKYERAASVAVIRTNTVTLAFLLDFAIRGAVPNWLSVIGAALIMCSCFGVACKNWKSSHVGN